MLWYCPDALNVSFHVVNGDAVIYRNVVSRNGILMERIVEYE
jgi:hypothetical protein